MSRASASTSGGNGSRVLRSSNRCNRSSACVELQTAARATASRPRVSLNSKQTLRFLDRAAATEKIRRAEPARRHHGDRLYAGPTVRTAVSWEARFDSPGPQAYNEGDKWRAKFRNVPSTCIDLATCARHMDVPTKPGPGDYNIAHHSIGDNSGGMKFGSRAPGTKYPPRTPDHPRAQTPCSYAEPKHVSCLRQQSTSNRPTSPTVFFGGAPRFQVWRRFVWSCTVVVPRTSRGYSTGYLLHTFPRIQMSTNGIRQCTCRAVSTRVSRFR